MAHFAELNGSNIVLRVCVVSNDTPTDIGPLGSNDKHVDGETWCTNFFGGTWKQTSYNSKFRKQFAGTGFSYDSGKDKFISPKPYPSWALDPSDNWLAPVTYPNITQISEVGDLAIDWDEDNLRWTAIKASGENYIWSGSAWSQV